MAEPALFGSDLFGDAVRPRSRGPVSDRFTFPPFSVLDARTGEWQDRKRAWHAIGIKSELGRDGGKTFNLGMRANPENGWQIEDNQGSGTSVFDPVLTELCYRWFCPPGGQIVDPFAGGSVRGIVAGSLGRDYWGCDMRPEQVESNQAQALDIMPDTQPVWVCGDSTDTLEFAPVADFVFSCPPYGNLEKYSDLEGDLSNMDWDHFVIAYHRIIALAIDNLRQDSFACFVVGDFRDSKGFYRDFVSTTIAAFEACGAMLYNEAILATPIGTAALRVTKQFVLGRKLAKIHQNVLVFCKGDWKKASAKCTATVESE